MNYKRDSIGNRIFLLWMLLILSLAGMAQKKSDTTALINEFNKVLEFAVQPNVFYSSITSMHNTPDIRMADSTGVLHGNFYKLNNDLYYGNEKDEMYLQDSLMITISHIRKTIQVSKVDFESKGKMNLLPLTKLSMQKILRENYTITKSRDETDTVKIILRSQEKEGPQGTTSNEMILAYGNNSLRPFQVDITLHIKQPVSDQLLSMLSGQGINPQKLIKEEDGVQYLLFSQTAVIRFEEMAFTKEKAQQMPLWKDKIAYDEAEQLFKGKGSYEDYEIIKTF